MDNSIEAQLDRAYRNGALEMFRVCSASLHLKWFPNQPVIGGWDKVEKFREVVEGRANPSR